MKSAIRKIYRAIDSENCFYDSQAPTLLITTQIKEIPYKCKLGASIASVIAGEKKIVFLDCSAPLIRMIEQRQRATKLLR